MSYFYVSLILICLLISYELLVKNKNCFAKNLYARITVYAVIINYSKYQFLPKQIIRKRFQNVKFLRAINNTFN